MKRLTVGIFNDSFPPTIDGVANTVVNYAKEIQSQHGKAVVATPKYPNVVDEYPFKVMRYASAHVSKRIGYRMGYPFGVLLIKDLLKEKMDIIHVHSPFVSMVLARIIRQYTGVPIVFTYHTKFDIDIQKRIATNTLQRASLKFILSNIQASDAVWVVSEGAGENLKSLGYRGDYKIMPNGTDFKKGKSSEAELKAFDKTYSLAEHETVFLFVGRMMWYKNIKLILDALYEAKQKDVPFKMFFVGDGVDREDIMAYARQLHLDEYTVFTGAISSREALRVFFSRADLFLFPSTYDTNGIVVREAAACHCPSLLVKDSCAAEGIVHGFTGIIVDENVASVRDALIEAASCREGLKEVGNHAAEHVYLSWSDAVKMAFEAYNDILDH